MTLTRYCPQAVMLPTDSQTVREFHDKRTHLPGKPALTADAYQSFETHTVFNDIFISADGNSLRALGPPLVNLKKILLPLDIRVNKSGGPLRHRISIQDRVTFHEFTLPDTVQQSGSLEYTIRFANGWETSGTAHRQHHAPVTLQFTTLQKNNPVIWILDWLRYCKMLGVERILLYDNGSDNVEELANAIEQAHQLPDIVLIDWPFPYGPAHSRYNQFCQASQNNHAHQCFAGAQWIGHFDVDEYLVLDNKHTLLQFLQQTPSRVGLLRFDSHWVPNLESQTMPGVEQTLHTVHDFAYREQEARGKAHKYIARHEQLRMANTHNGKLNFGHRRKLVAPEQAVFLHYKALSNHWKGPRGQAEPFDEQRHIRDDRVINCLQRAMPS